MKISYKKVLKYLLVIAWMIVIYKFSSDPADVSDGKSGLVIEMLTSVGINVNSVFGEFANFVVRKLGHFTEYFILSLLLVNAIREDFELRKSFKLALSISFLYACSDEYHQTFVPGRSGRFADVLIDTSGAFLALLLLYIIIKVKKKK
ncbi:VanZ family protein [uncultured Clostridium sp.]|uniref:VanZ family protein n=1 Tax=uncultured Clostridium sp. TaxID=59620 RepID=UPI0028E7B84A|nr:VanZ family protein [uncultured Clostridium sp.]